MDQFVHLHLHTEYSLLDGACRLQDLVSQASQMGMPAMAITDHGVMYGAIDFYEMTTKAGIKPIIGCEVYLAPRGRRDRTPKVDDRLNHLVLLARDTQGYRNLMKLISLASLEGFYYKPRIDKELLDRYHGGLIALSSCLAGEVPSLILKGNLEKAREAAGLYQEIFGKGSFYLELQYQGIPAQVEANRGLIGISKDLGIPLVATNDVHYVKKDYAGAHDVLLCIQTGKRAEDPDRLRFETQEFYLKGLDEMSAIFLETPEAIRNTLVIADQCHLTLELNKAFHLPAFPVPEGTTQEEYLRSLCTQGLKRRFSEATEEVMARLNYELDVIRSKGLEEYFLIVWDFIHYAKEKKIPVGPGRGSVAGSLVAYLLGITEIDPLKYGLIFERFLNPERRSLPDIDTDFCDANRGEIIQYVTRKYGEDRVAQIVTFGKMKARAAIRDAGRVLNYPLPLVDKVAKLIPPGPGGIHEALQQPEIVRLMEENPGIRTLVETAMTIEGLPRNASIHAAGVVIAKDDLTEHVPLQKMNGDEVVCQYAMGPLERIGLLKMDFLGLRNLTVMKDALDLIEENTGTTLDLLKIPDRDRKTYQMLCEGHTTGVFQLESSGMRNMIRDLRPQSFEDIISLMALYRPGPLQSGMVEEFMKVRHGKSAIRYLHPSLEPILKETCGLILYQEQVMRIAHDLGGLTLGEADDLRKAMGKKKPEVMARYRPQFIEGASSRGIPSDLAEKIFDLMQNFAEYGFNKSHSAAYGLVSYQTAYLKARYPVEYMAALLTSVSGKNEKIMLYINECKRLDIQILPPQVNVSQVNFAVSEGKIRFGLGAIKNVGDAAIRSILEARKDGGSFRDLFDFCARADLRAVNRKVIESLIKSGALDGLGPNRASLLASLDEAMERAGERRREVSSGQISLFGGEESVFSFPLFSPVEKEELPKPTLLALEKEMLGLYISDHPLSSIAADLAQVTSTSTQDLAEAGNGTTVTLGGIVNSLRRILSRSNQAMAFFDLEDLKGKVEVVVFPKVYEKCAQILQEDALVILTGKVEVRERDEGEQGGAGSSGDDRELLPGQFTGEEGIQCKVIADRVESFSAGKERLSAGRSLSSQGKKQREYKSRPSPGDSDARERERSPSPPGKEGSSASQGQEVHITLELHKVPQTGLATLKEVLKELPGEHPVFLHLESATGRSSVLLGKEYRVGETEKIAVKLKSLLGEGARVTWGSGGNGGRDDRGA